MIKFRIDDASRNTGESEVCAVWVYAADPSAPVISSPTYLGRGVGATEIVKYGQYV